MRIIFLLVLLHWSAGAGGPASPSTAAATTASPYPIMHTALEQTLHLQFSEALETAMQLQESAYPALAFRLTRGMIAYFQWRWQTRQSSESLQSGQTLLQEVLAEGKKQLATTPRDAQLLLFLGLAATFDALLQQEQDTWQSLQLFSQGKAWLQRALVAEATVMDAHLGLGLLYFATTDVPAWLRRFWESLSGLSIEASVHHLQQAISGGHFTRHVAQTFLVRLYVLEKRYDEAIALGQTLQDTFPENGQYALFTGRSQCALRQYARCAETLEALARRLHASETPFGQRDDRLEMYYYLGIARNEIGQYDLAFEALRQAINEDPRNEHDVSLWAKYHLATLYERRGQPTTARQLYQTLLRGRNVEDLHRRAQQRLAHLQ
jgi:tetratricopeptide (TPR) repeat protein